ncbi:MAG: hypothetical protein H0X04_00025 [Chthoniobacterales bacterium]|nr:hypothetical protein [Chthoniobacterales bacterium]
MKPKPYSYAVAWIALNDEPGAEWARRPAEVAQQISAVLVADIYGVTPLAVGRDVVGYRPQSCLRD